MSLNNYTQGPTQPPGEALQDTLNALRADIGMYFELNTGVLCVLGASENAAPPQLNSDNSTPYTNVNT